MTSKIKAVIFDMDGVLIDTEPHNEIHMVLLLKRLGIEITPHYLQKFRGAHAKYIWSHISHEYNLSQSIEELIANARISYLEYLTSLKNLEPVEGIVPLLKKLKKQKNQLAVASSASNKRVHTLLEICKLINFFDVIVSGDHVQNSKPDPEIYIKTAKLLKRVPKDCVVFEDATNGVLSAKAAGMKVVGYKGADHNTQDLSRSDIVVQNFNKITFSLLQSL